MKQSISRLFWPKNISTYLNINGCKLFHHSSRLRFSSQVLPDQQQRIFSGIQPTGTLHLGNYFGAVQQWINLQNAGKQCTYSLVDMHAITQPQEPSVLQSNILEMTAVLLACGLDPQKCTLYQQSKVKQHAELCWILICLTYMGRLGQQPQFKDKTSNKKEIPLGLFVYPVLQAADILLHNTTHVPAGEDQISHLDLTQQLAQKFNNRYGQTFPPPKIMLTDARRLKSLRDPSKKMSKSDLDTKSYITFLDSDSDILKKCKKAVTDSTSAVTYEPEKRPGVSNLILIHSGVTGKTPEQICTEAEGLETAEYKMVLADVLIEWIRPIRTEAFQLLSDPLYIESILSKGSSAAAEIAECTMEKVRQSVGFARTVKNLQGENMKSTQMLHGEEMESTQIL